jgi:membrane protein
MDRKISYNHYMVIEYLKSRGSGIYRFMRRVIESYSAHNCPRHAAALAYYTLFSLFPLLLLLIIITSNFFPSAASRQNLANSLAEIFPYGAENLYTIIEQTWNARRSMGLISSIGLLWGGSAMFSMLETSLSRIWETDPRPFWHRRVIGVVSVLAVVVIFLASFFFGPFTASILDGFPLDSQTLNYLMQMIVVTIIAMLLYRIYPNEQVEWGAAFVGAFTAAIMIVLAKFLFGFYTIIVTAQSGLLYGSLTWFLTMALWVYLVGSLFLFGAEFSAAFQTRQQILRQNANSG